MLLRAGNTPAAPWMPMSELRNNREEQQPRLQNIAYSTIVIPLKMKIVVSAHVYCPSGIREAFAIHLTHVPVRLLLQFDINRNILEHLSAMPPFLSSGYRNLNIEEHRALPFPVSRGSTALSIGVYLTIILQQRIVVIHHLNQCCV